jgi:hypothetical protein
MQTIFRIIFLIWASVWGVINLFQIVYQYARFNSVYETGSDAKLGLWFWTVSSLVISVALGISLLYKVSIIPRELKEHGKVPNLGAYTVMIVFYYFFVNLMSIGSNFVLNRSNFLKEFTFTTAWLFPSLIMFVFHIFYFLNLESKSTGIKEAK